MDKSGSIGHATAVVSAEGYTETMMSVVVLADASVGPLPSAEAIVRTLSALVPAAIEGLVRDVVLAGTANPQSPEDLARIADHAGCALVEAPATQLLPQALATTRGPHVLVLLAGDVPGEGFVEQASDVIASRAQVAKLRRHTSGFWGAAFPNLAPVTGVIAPKAALLEAKPQSFADLVALAGKAPALPARTRHIV